MPPTTGTRRISTCSSTRWRAGTRRLHQGTHELAVAAWHPDGGRLLLVADEAEGDQALSVLDLASGAVHAVPHARPCSFGSLRWSKDGILRGLSDRGGEFKALCRIDTETGAVEPMFSAGERMSRHGRCRRMPRCSPRWRTTAATACCASGPPTRRSARPCAGMAW